MNSMTMKNPTKAEVSEYARELEDLVVDMFNLLQSAITYADRDGWLKTRTLIHGIPNRMTALGLLDEQEVAL